MATTKTPRETTSRAACTPIGASAPEVACGAHSRRASGANSSTLVEKDDLVVFIDSPAHGRYIAEGDTTPAPAYRYIPCDRECCDPRPALTEPESGDALVDFDLYAEVV